MNCPECDLTATVYDYTDNIHVDDLPQPVRVMIPGWLCSDCDLLFYGRDGVIVIDFAVELARQAHKKGK